MPAPINSHGRYWFIANTGSSIAYDSARRTEAINSRTQMLSIAQVKVVRVAHPAGISD